MKDYVKSLFTPTAIRQLVKVGLVGVVNTVVSFTLFNIFLSLLGGTKTTDEGFNWEQFWSIALSFLIATFVSYMLNRRWTFELSEPGEIRRETTRFVGINIVAWAMTQMIVGGADWVWGPLTRTEQNFFYLLASGLIILPKFAGYRDIVFRRAIDAQAMAAIEEKEMVAADARFAGERATTS
ncbi:MAG: GtrA family protein [Acidimicrobiia bacterium]|nr:GtrA family protein [Acidimicrobiia bacterium]